MPCLRPPAVEVLVEVDADDLVGGEEAVLDALLERVGVNRVAEVIDVRDRPGFLRRRGQADLGGGGEILEDLSPGGVLRGASAMALVDDDQVEEVGRELLVDVAGLLGAGDGLVERQVDLVGLVDLSLLDLGHRRAERLEVVRLGLVDQDVAVGEEQDALLDPGLPEPPDDLERGVGLAGAGRHDQQDAVLSVGDCLDRAVDGVELVVTGRLAGAVVVVALGDDRQPIRRDLLPLAVSLPEFIRRRERVEGEFLLDLRVGPRAVVEEKPVAVRAEHEGQVERFLSA